MLSYFLNFTTIVMDGNDKDKETPERPDRDTINKEGDKAIKDADKQDRETFGPNKEPSPKPSGQ